jgi:hypothetical protein
MDAAASSMILLEGPVVRRRWEKRRDCGRSCMLVMMVMVMVVVMVKHRLSPSVVRDELKTAHENIWFDF